ncbi:RNA-directed DNA polymerase, eukaryota, reverse transcriptase zinc-binding domain protein, partial [Tanacetum coccineum]
NGLNKTKPAKIPIWIKLSKVPLEAWPTKGISALTSRCGKPVCMDDVTASMCKFGIGRVGYARVLVEIGAKKELPSKFDVVYRNAEKEIQARKSGNDDNSQKEMKNGSGSGNDKHEEAVHDGFTEVTNKKNVVHNEVSKPMGRKDWKQNKTVRGYGNQPDKNINKPSTPRMGFQPKVDTHRVNKERNTQMNNNDKRGSKENKKEVTNSKSRSNGKKGGNSKNLNNKNHFLF